MRYGQGTIGGARWSVCERSSKPPLTRDVRLVLLMDNETIAAAIGNRRRYQRRVLAGRPVGERMAEFAKLQRGSFHVLQASPRGYGHFLRRNLHARRVEVMDGVWKPVSPARRAQQV
jgi:hypothetical protein